MKSVAILNSRQHLRPIGSDQWIYNSKLAVHNIAAQNQQLLTSIGMNSWELLVYLASKFNIAQRIYLPSSSGVSNTTTISYIIREFRLKPDLVDWRLIEITDAKKDYSKFQKLRDQMIISDADIIYPIALRPDSTLSKLCTEHKKETVLISNQYVTLYNQNSYSCKIDIDKQLINVDIDNNLSEFIIHWTRSSNNRWPGEILYDYYDDLVNSADNYPRSAYYTLLRILKEKKLRASGRHYRKGIEAVAFSELKPTRAVNLMKWRARYSEMTFEPYGIAIKKKAANNLGIKPVIYGNKELYNRLESGQRPYYQSVGTKGFWLPEKEWRHIGDIDLSVIQPEDMKLIVWRRDEIEYLRNFTSSEVISLYG